MGTLFHALQLDMEEITLNCFFKLTRLGLGAEKYSDFPDLSERQWNGICSIAQRQSMSAFLIKGIECLPREKRPGTEVINKLMKICLTVEKINRKLNHKAVRVSDFFRSNGFNPVILKGQGVSTLYEKPEWRMPGDIDVWLTDERSKVTEFVKGIKPEAEVLYHHIHMNEEDGLDVEVHTVPAFLYNPFSNRKLNDYFGKWKDMTKNVELPDSAGRIVVPCDEMNRVFLLIHKYRHLFCEGIGLKQMADYMMLLRKGFTGEERVRTVRILKDLHLTAFCRAVMFVLTDALGMEKEYLLMEPDEKAGKLLLNEIITAGNFGKYDTRIDRSIKGDSLKSFYYRNKRNMRFLHYFPNEVIWGFYFKIYNWFWRRINNR